MNQTKRVLGAAFAVAAMFASQLPAFAADKWEIDPAHSTARFKVTHLMISKVSGEVTGCKGEFTSDGDDVTKLTADVTLDVATVNTNNAKRDEHLKSPDFFDVAKFPTMTFKSTKVTKAGGDKFKMMGALTMHGVTKNVTLEGVTLTKSIKDPWGNTRRGFSAKTTIVRKDFGLNWNKALDGGGVVVGEKAEVELEVELQQPAPAKEVKGR